MRLLYILIVVLSLHVKSALQCTDCKNTYLSLDTKAECCRHITNGNFYECTGWTNPDDSDDSENTDCIGWDGDVIEGHPVIRNHAYPPYFERQPHGSARCAYAVYHNVLAFAGINPNTLSTDDIIEIGDALIVFSNGVSNNEYVQSDTNNDIANIAAPLYRWLMPLSGLKIEPKGTPNEDSFAWYNGFYGTTDPDTNPDHIMRQAGGGFQDPIRIKAMINNARFIGFVFATQSSDGNWFHETTLLKDPRGPYSSPEFWYFDPAFPVLTQPFTTQTWTRHRKIKSKLTDENGLARVGVDHEGRCTLDAVCVGISPFHNWEFDVMRGNNDFDQERWKFQASRGIESDDDVVTRIKEMKAKSVPVWSVEHRKWPKKDIKTSVNIGFLHKVNAIYRMTDAELYNEFLNEGVKANYYGNIWHTNKNKGIPLTMTKLQTLVKFWSGNVITKCRAYWIADYIAEPKTGYWAPLPGSPPLSDNKKRSHVLFKAELLRLTTSANPTDLNDETTKKLKEYEIEIVIPLYKSGSFVSAPPNNNNNYWKFTELMIGFDILVFVLICAVLAMCTGCFVGYIVRVYSSKQL